MKNIYILPTDKPSRLTRALHYNNSLRLVHKNYKCDVKDEQYQNMYITSDVEIKDGDVVKIPCGVGKVKKLNWKFGNDNPSYIVEDIFINKLRYGQKEGELQINSFRYEDVKKIILTTDQYLIKDGVQEIDDGFLEWFVKNLNCEKIKIIDVRDLNVYGSFYPYKIIIPKEEPKTKCYCGHTIYCDCAPLEELKQETLEEVRMVKRTELYNSILSIVKQLPRKEVQDDAMDAPSCTYELEQLFLKWQQEQDKNKYSEEEVLKIIDLLFHKYASSFRVDAKEDFLLSKKK